MKIYISLPVTGRDIEEVEDDCIFFSGVLKMLGHEAISPLEVSPNPDATYAEHMGNDIRALMECDAALFTSDWKQSKGCLLEHCAAKIYGKQIFYSIEEVRNFDSPH